MRRNIDLINLWAFVVAMVAYFAAVAWYYDWLAPVFMMDRDARIGFASVVLLLMYGVGSTATTAIVRWHR